MAYFTSREEFNKVKVGDKVKFEVSRLTIERFIHIESYRTGDVENIFLWKNGKVKAIPQESPQYAKTKGILVSTLKSLNIQARCYFSKDDIQRIREENEVVELRFALPVNITISQWVDPDGRDHIPADEKGYRILDNVKAVLFITEDNLNMGLNGHVLVYHEVGGGVNHDGCWAIGEEDNGGIDKRWINELEGITSLELRQLDGLMTPPLQKLEDISKQHSTVRKYLETAAYATPNRTNQCPQTSRRQGT